MKTFKYSIQLVYDGHEIDKGDWVLLENSYDSFICLPVVHIDDDGSFLCSYGGHVKRVKRSDIFAKSLSKVLWFFRADALKRYVATGDYSAPIKLRWGNCMVEVIVYGAVAE